MTNKRFALLSRSATDPLSLFLISRDYYILGEFREGQQVSEKAVIAEPESSEYVDWLGDAYDRNAWTSNPLSWVVRAKNARQAFEREVRLNPQKAEALSDLFDCHLQAPASACRQL